MIGRQLIRKTNKKKYWTVYDIYLNLGQAFINFFQKINNHLKKVKQVPKNWKISIYSWYYLLKTERRFLFTD